MRRVLKILAVLVLVVSVALAVFAVTTVRKSFPDTTGTLQVTGLIDAVTISRDEHGIPVIEAQNEDDLFFAQGFVHAQDRFFEMDFRRHVTAGRLAELVGEAALPSDKFVRTLGWRRVAEAEWDLLSQDTRRMLQSYADGVNAYLEGKSADELSLEYAVLDLTGPTYKPETWEPVDSIAWAKAMAWDLRSNMNDEMARAWAAAAVGVERAEELYPPYSAEHPAIVTSGTVEGERFVSPDATGELAREALASLESAASAAEALPTLLGTGDALGSNSWVVGGEHTASGKPLLANDPHLAASMPGIWYQNHLRCAPDSECSWNVTGFSFTSLPGVVVGHNDHGAWGVTNLTADVSDLFIEKIDGDTYEFEGEARPIETREENFEVAGGDPVTITVRSTHHGPILSDLDADREDDQGFLTVARDALANEPSEEFAVALQWTALTPQNTVDALAMLGSADSWPDFRAAAEVFTTPSQNLVYADVEGNIAYQAPGMIPIRKSGDGRWPVPGWTGEHEWIDTINFDELPSVFNPHGGFIVTANNQVIGDQYPHDLGADMAQGYRADRIRQLITEGSDFTALDMAKMQLDSHNPAAEILVPKLLDIRLESAYYRQGTDTLRDWDFKQTPDSKGAAYFNTVWRHALALTFHDELPERSWPSGGERWFAVMAHLVDDPMNPWWDDASTPARVETRDDILAEAMRLARDELTRTQSRHPNKWRWGAMHDLTLTNQTLGTSGVGVVEWLFNRGTFEPGGGGGIVNATGWDATAGYEVTTVPSMRMVVDLADLDNSRWIQLTGNSGHAFHSNYVDQAPLWAAGETLPWRFSAEATEADAEDVLTLAPQR